MIKMATATGQMNESVITKTNVAQAKMPGKTSKNRYINRSFLSVKSGAFPILR